MFAEAMCAASAITTILRADRGAETRLRVSLHDRPLIVGAVSVCRSRCAFTPVLRGDSIHPSMSAAHPSAADAAAVPARAPFRARPRHFWDGPDPADEGVEGRQGSDSAECNEEKQGAALVSPVTRLYRHALESVFGFLDLKELSHVLSVSHSWAAAVRSMKSIGAAVTSKRVSSWMIAASPLASHVRHFRSDSWKTEVSIWDLFVLSCPPIALLSLQCAVDLSEPPSCLFLGASLKSLALLFKGIADIASVVNDAIVTISQLPVLEWLVLRLPSFFPAVNFAPLAVAPQLRALRCQAADYSQPSRPQLDQLRMMPHLSTMDVVNLSGVGLIHLLRVPHSMQWQEIQRVNTIDGDVAAALSALPTLTDWPQLVAVARLSSLPSLACAASCCTWTPLSTSPRTSRLVCPVALSSRSCR